MLGCAKAKRRVAGEINMRANLSPPAVVQPRRMVSELDGKTLNFERVSDMNFR